MKKTINLAWANAELSKNENNEYILTEIIKDGEKTYNLTNYLEELIGEDTIGITIKNTLEVPSEE